MIRKSLAFSLVFAFLICCVACNKYEDRGMAVDDPSEIAFAIFFAFDKQDLEEARELVSEIISDEDIQALSDSYNDCDASDTIVQPGSDASSYIEIKGDEPSLKRNQSVVSVILKKGGVMGEDVGWICFIVQKNPSTGKSYIIDMGIKLL